MALHIEELDASDTPIGVISLRRRYEPVVGEDVYEVKIDDEFLMSSLFTVVEQELAHLGLALIGRTGGDLHVLVGGSAWATPCAQPCRTSASCRCR